MSVMQKVFLYNKISLAISAEDVAAAFECLLVRHNEKKKNTNSKLWPYYYYYYY